MLRTVAVGLGEWPSILVLYHGHWVSVGTVKIHKRREALLLLL